MIILMFDSNFNSLLLHNNITLIIRHTKYLCYNKNSLQMNSDVMIFNVMLDFRECWIACTNDLDQFSGYRQSVPALLPCDTFEKSRISGNGELLLSTCIPNYLVHSVTK